MSGRNAVIRLRRRPSRTVPASLVAVVLLAVGVLTVLCGGNRLVNGRWPGPVTASARTVAGSTWGSTVVVLVALAVALVGLALVVAGLKPGALRAATLQAPAAGAVGDTEYVISTRAVARLAAARADTVDGVDQVAASASTRRVHLRVTTTSEQAAEIGDRVRQRVSDGLTAAGLAPVPRVTTSVRTKGL